MNPRTRVIVSEFWEFVAFFVNSIVFLLIGDQIRFSNLADNLLIIGITIVGMVISRLISVYALGFFSNTVAKSEISLPQQTILWWGGLRGSVSIALALSVPTILGNEREDLISTVFGVVLFTLLVQGLTTKPLLKKLNLLGDQPLRQEYLKLVAHESALKRALKYLEEVDDERPRVDSEFCRYQEALIKGELKNIEEKIDILQDEYPNLREFARQQLQDELLAVEADTYAEFVRSGRLNQELAPLLQQVLE
jgi:CPA1 family monovalent cation:H+ antiporter